MLMLSTDLPDNKFYVVREKVSELAYLSSDS